MLSHGNHTKKSDLVLSAYSEYFIPRCLRGAKKLVTLDIERLAGIPRFLSQGGPCILSFIDQTLTCRDCGSEFIFTVGEQEFFQQKGLINQPSRCTSCRARHRAENGGSRQPDRERSFPREPREQFSAVCATCGAETTVPFQPSNHRPVYCSSCYDKVRVRAPRR